MVSLDDVKIVDKSRGTRNEPPIHPTAIAAEEVDLRR